LVAQSASVGKGRERALAMYQGITAVGAVAGPSSGSAIVAATGRWEDVFVVLVAASAIALVTSFLLPPPPVRFHAPAPAEMWRAARDPGVLIMAAVSGVVGVTIMTMHSSLAFIFRVGELPSQWMSSVGFAMIPCGVLSGSFLVRSLLQRYEARTLLGISLMALGTAIAAFGAVHAWLGASLLLFPLLAASGVGLGAGMALSIGVATSLAASSPGTVSAVVVVARNLGTTIAPFIVGIAYDISALWLAYVVAVVCIVAVRLLMVWWGRRSRDATPEVADVAA
jgi:predicted MFS family arabinose efflux permease